MRTTACFLSACLILLGLAATIAGAQTSATTFTYQGELKDAGSGVNAPAARLLLRLWNAETGGTQVGSDCLVYPVQIANGIFTALVDFGATAFDGQARWLQIGVDTSGGTVYTWLTPRHRVTATPYSIYALHGGDSPWLLNGDNIWIEDSNVGINVDDPSFPLEASANGLGRAVSGTSVDPTGTAIGVYGASGASDGRGVAGYALHATGTGRGVFGTTNSPSGFGVFGINTAQTGTAVGVYGETGSSSGFAGYFAGRGFFSGNVGIGASNPASKLDITGTARMTGFQLTTSPQAGYVLTSDANGLGSWQASPAGGISGSGSTNYVPKFVGTTSLGNSHIYETGPGNVGIGMTSPLYPLDVQGTIRVTGFKLSNAPQAGYVLTSDASGQGTWLPASGFALPYSGSVSSTGATFQVTNTGTGQNSHAVAGIINSSTSSSDAAAGFFDATGSNGHGLVAKSSSSASAIYALNSAGFANALRAEVTAGEAIAICATANGVAGTGLLAAGGARAAALYGKVAIYEFGTNNLVMELGKGLDYAEGFDVSRDATEVTPGTVLVIDPDNPGQLARSRCAYDRKVAGIVAGANGLGSGVRLGSGQFDHNVALAGRVFCNVVALDEPVAPGDLLTTSSIPGYAMKVRDHDRAQGAILGKAMEPLAAGEKRQILVLVTLQ
jgi:hypothetical protein